MSLKKLNNGDFITIEDVMDVKVTKGSSSPGIRIRNSVTIKTKQSEHVVEFPNHSSAQAYATEIGDAKIEAVKRFKNN